MTVWNTLFDDALSEIGRTDSTNTGSTADRAICLRVANRLLSGWSAEIGPIYQETTDALTWTGGNASRTIGSGGNFAVARPERILAAQYRDGSQDEPIAIITHQQYQAIPDKSHSSSIPKALAYNTTAGTGTLYIWPVPSADTAIRLTSYKPFTAISDATADSGLPSGYEAAFVPWLAMLIAPTFGAVVSVETRTEALRAKSAIIRANIVQQPMKPDYGGDSVDEVNAWTTP